MKGYSKEMPTVTTDTVNRVGRKQGLLFAAGEHVNWHNILGKINWLRNAPTLQLSNYALKLILWEACHTCTSTWWLNYSTASKNEATLYSFIHVCLHILQDLWTFLFLTTKFGAEEMAQWLKCLPWKSTKMAVQIPSTHVNTGWSWHSTCKSSLGR